MNAPPKNRTNHSEESDIPLLGSFLLIAGIGLLVLVLIDNSWSLPFSMPRAWYTNRYLWPFAAVAAIVAGVACLRTKPTLSPGWRAELPGVRFSTVILYTRANCHLCDQAKETLLQYSRYLPEIAEVDIDQNEITIERFGECVPVVEIDGVIRFRGHVNEMLLRRLINGSRPSVG